MYKTVNYHIIISPRNMEQQPVKIVVVGDASPLKTQLMLRYSSVHSDSLPAMNKKKI